MSEVIHEVNQSSMCCECAYLGKNGLVEDGDFVDRFIETISLRVFPNMKWTKHETYSSQCVVYLNSPRISQDASTLPVSLGSYFVGLDVVTRRCFVTGNPSWSCSHPLDSYVCPYCGTVSEKTLDFLISSMSALTERYDSEEKRWQ